MRRLVVAAAVSAAVVATAVPSLADSTNAPSAPHASLPVGVVVSTDGGVFVGTTFEGRPLVAAQVAGGSACVGVSLEVPFCTPPVTISDNIPRDITVGPAYVHVSTDGGVGVATGLDGQPLWSASVANGWACIGFSYEIPFCYPLNSQNRAIAGI